ncbi:hypothetical protein AYO44_17380 [Planctomycetaceae bacterium SCGC AG-212-F19]|nr:hypothetical protein AYO44_17380 [Planctomycetaceae bacterium SCGC AG-212-F19]
MQKLTGGPKYNVAFPFHGEVTPLEDILYEHLRCVLIHEGGMPDGIILTPPRFENGKKLNVMELRDPWGFPEGWVNNLLSIVVLAPENEPLFRDWVALQREYEGRQQALKAAKPAD